MYCVRVKTPTSEMVKKLEDTELILKKVFTNNLNYVYILYIYSIYYNIRKIHYVKMIHTPF